MSAVDRVVSAVTERSRTIIAVLLVVTLLVGAGAGDVQESSQVSVAGNSDTAAANDYVMSEFSERGENTTTAAIAVSDEDGNVLSRASLLRELRFQRQLVTNETVNATLVEDQSVGLANIVAVTAMSADGDAPDEPTIDEQIDQLESMSDEEVATVVERVLDPDGDHPRTRTALSLLPRDFDPGSGTADSRLIVMTQETQEPVRTASAVSGPVADGQLAAREIAHDQNGPETYRMIGSGLVGTQEDAAIEGSLGIVGPLALLFVLVSLSIAYRDLLDVGLGLFGVVVVLVWTFGFMGWTGIAFNQVMIAVPILLIGLSVDYAFHVVMRYREERSASDGRSGSDTSRDGGVRPAMARSLGGVGPALALVTLTTMIGFLANLTSPLSDLREFGVAAAAGIAATLVVFGLLVPALKVEIDSFLEARGWDRSKRAFGTGGRLGDLLASGSTLARRAPVAVVVIAVLVTAGGAAGAAQVDTSYSAESFLADDPPGWTEELPEDVQPGEFYLKDNRDYIYSQFQTPTQQGEVLIEGDVTAPDTLERVSEAESEAVEQDVTVERSTGEPAVVSPLSAMERTAAADEQFAETFEAADTDGDGIPDQDLEKVYDAFYEANPSLATRYVHRTEDGEYDALRLRMGIDGNAEPATVSDQVETVATSVGTGDGLAVTATGQPLVATEIAEQLTSTVVESLVVTIAAILVLLTLVFRRANGSASLGAVALVPVLFAVTWLLGSMALLNIPISVITALVGSIAVGLGVDYAIHIADRFTYELENGLDAATALRRTVVGTGGALLSSAATTAAGFGVLGFALLPGLSQFGISLALGIVYAFLASVFVLPSLLALWARYVPGPIAHEEPAPSTADDD